MPFIIFIPIVVRINNTSAVCKHNAMFNGHAGSDIDRQILIRFHVCFESCRNHLYFSRQHLCFHSAFYIISGTHGSFTPRKGNTCIFQVLTISKPLFPSIYFFSWSKALRERLIRPLSSISVTLTIISSPS